MPWYKRGLNSLNSKAWYNRGTNRLRARPGIIEVLIVLTGPNSLPPWPQLRINRKDREPIHLRVIDVLIFLSMRFFQRTSGAYGPISGSVPQFDVQTYPMARQQHRGLLFYGWTDQSTSPWSLCLFHVSKERDSLEYTTL